MRELLPGRTEVHPRQCSYPADTSRAVRPIAAVAPGRTTLPSETRSMLVVRDPSPATELPWTEDSSPDPTPQRCPPVCRLHPENSQGRTAHEVCSPKASSLVLRWRLVPRSSEPTCAC